MTVLPDTPQIDAFEEARDLKDVGEAIRYREI
jgi:hypothetical protein